MLRALTRPITQASVARRSIAAASAHRSLHTAPILARLAQRSANAGPGTPNVRQSAQRAKQMAERASSAPSSSRASSPFPSDAAFFAQVESTYARLRTGLGDMLAANPTMHLLSEGHSPPSLEVACGPDRGSFTFNVDQAQHQLVMFTPITAASDNTHTEHTTQPASEEQRGERGKRDTNSQHASHSLLSVSVLCGFLAGAAHTNTISTPRIHCGAVPRTGMRSRNCSCATSFRRDCTISRSCKSKSSPALLMQHACPAAPADFPHQPHAAACKQDATPTSPRRLNRCIWLLAF